MGMTVKMARVGAKMTQQQMADGMGVHVQTYAKMENDPESMTIEQGKLFCRIAGVSFNEIFFVNESN